MLGTHTQYTQYTVYPWLLWRGETRPQRKAEPGADEGPGANYVSSSHVNVPDSSEPDSGVQGVEAIGSGH